MKRILFIFLVISFCFVEQNSSNILHGIFYDDDLSFVRYGSIDLNTKQFLLINSLDIKEVGDFQKTKYGIPPLTYDPNNDVIFMSGSHHQNKSILTRINATTGELLTRFNAMDNAIISLEYDIFQRELFAHIETDQENITEIVQIDENNGKIKQSLGRIVQAQATHIAAYCPICRKYFLLVKESNTYTYIGVNSTDGGGISWRTPIDFHPIDMKFDYKTFTMFTLYLNQTDQLFYLGILNRTIGGIGQIISRINNDSKMNVTSPTAFDIEQKLFYSFTLTNSNLIKGISYVNTNTSDVKSISFDQNQYNPYAWFIKQFVH